MDPTELLRRAQRVYAKLCDAGELSRDEIVNVIGSEDSYRAVCLGLNRISKAAGRRGPSGGLTRAPYARKGLTEVDQRGLREFFEEYANDEMPPNEPEGPLSSEAERLKKLLASDGGSLGRREIIETLGFSDEQYSAAAGELVEAGFARKNRGRSGGLSLTEKEGKDDTKKIAGEPVRAKEQALYPPFTAYLEKAAKINDESRSVVLQTFRTRQRKWESPDLTEVRVTPFPVLGQWELRIATYELKRADGWSIDSVLQTATYSEFAHESWLVVPSEGDGDWVDHFTKRVVDKAGSSGIGLATFIEDSSVMKKHMVPKRQLPELARLHEWLEEVVDRLREPQLMKDIANNIGWARRKADAGRD